MAGAEASIDSSPGRRPMGRRVKKRAEYERRRTLQRVCAGARESSKGRGRRERGGGQGRGGGPDRGRGQGRGGGKGRGRAWGRARAAWRSRAGRRHCMVRRRGGVNTLYEYYFFVARRPAVFRRPLRRGAAQGAQAQ